jgi:hypothetical protein
LEGGPPSFTQDCTCPALLGIPLGVVRVILPGCHRLWRAVPGRFGLASYSHVAVPQPQKCKHPWFGLAPVRSPLLRGSRLLSLPPGTEMFQFPGFASLLREMTDLAAGRVSPFGNPGITASLQLPQAYRSLARPSSPPCAKASTVRPYALDLVALGVIPQHHTHHSHIDCQRADNNPTEKANDRVWECGRHPGPFDRRPEGLRLLGAPERR